MHFQLPLLRTPASTRKKPCFPPAKSASVIAVPFTGNGFSRAGSLSTTAITPPLFTSNIENDGFAVNDWYCERVGCGSDGTDGTGIGVHSAACSNLGFF